MSEVNIELARWSELFMYLASITYMFAFVAFAWDVAAHSRTTKRLEEAATVGGQDQEKELVGARTASSGSINARSARLTGTEQGTGERGMGYKRSAATKLSSHVADSDMRYGTGERRPAARAGAVILALGCLIHAAGVFSRAFAANRVPWGNMYEFCTTGAFLVAAVYLIFLVFRDLRFVGTLVSGLVLTMMVVANVVYPTPVGQLVPALQSYWLVIHVSIAVLASSIFTLTFAMAVLQLLQTSRERRILADQDTALTRLGFMRLIPSSTALENFSFRLNTVGFVMWTFTLAAGAIWAEKAWGRYWGWDTKEVWTFIIWVVYAAYLHARATRGWSGPPSAWLSIVGYLCVIFNFTIVNVFFSGLHSYSGL
ncbi:c-type cytochrome biogenesis protein CcsB [Rothia nasisuis]|uniref:c-type cytochrome biogenesis protein CcsB n=1 Tax=Rothia nasisuis TaxID=2109647 RepID=UPI001F006F31|nr:c-type cytochrome biogenesis protein CcsB [Rothia nasisuis]